MISNLKVNTNNFKKKIIYTTVALIMSSSVLSGCSVVNEDQTKNNNEEIVENDTYCIKITLKLNDYESLATPDFFIVYDDNNTIYNAADGDSEVKTILVYPESLDNLNISSEALDTSIDLPGINEGETYEVDIYYATKTYGVEVIKQEQEKGMSI